MKQEKKQSGLRRGNLTHTNEKTFVYPDAVALSLAQQDVVDPGGNVAYTNDKNTEDAKKFVDQNRK